MLQCLYYLLPILSYKRTDQKKSSTIKHILSKPKYRLLVLLSSLIQFGNPKMNFFVKINEKALLQEIVIN